MLLAKLGLKMTKKGPCLIKESMVDILTCNHGLHQLINETTHFFYSSSSCIDLYSPLNQTVSWSLGFNPLFSQIVIISWYLLSSFYPSIILHLMKEQYDTTTEQMLISTGRQLTSLTGIRHYASMVWIHMLLFSVTL